MTCIVAVVDQETKTVYMGGDSCGSGENSWATYSNPKVFVVDQFVFGGAGSFRMLDLLAYSFDPPSRPEGKSTEAFMRTDFINAVRECFDEGGIMKEADGVLTFEGSDFLVGYRGHLYHVQEDFSILTCNEWGYAIGSGEEPARGSLWTTRTYTNAENRVQIALAAAEAVVPGVRGPFTVVKIELHSPSEP